MHRESYYAVLDLHGLLFTAKKNPVLYILATLPVQSQLAVKNGGLITLEDPQILQTCLA